MILTYIFQLLLLLLLALLPALFPFVFISFHRVRIHIVKIALLYKLKSILLSKLFKIIEYNKILIHILLNNVSNFLTHRPLKIKSIFNTVRSFWFRKLILPKLNSIELIPKLITMSLHLITISKLTYQDFTISSCANEKSSNFKLAWCIL